MVHYLVINQQDYHCPIVVIGLSDVSYVEMGHVKTSCLILDW